MIRPVGPFRKVLTGEGGRLLPPFFPLNLPNLEEYYDARTPALTLANGANVNPWVDLSGKSRNMNNFPFDNPPTLIKTGSNLSPKGKPLVAANGVDQSLITGTINPMPNPNTRGYSFHVYGNWLASGGGGIIWQDDTGLRPQLIINTSNGDLAWRDTANVRNFPGQGLTGFHLYSFVFALGGAGRVYRDGVLVGSATWTIAYNTMAATILFCNQVQNAHLPVREGFFCWYSDTHSAATVSLFSLWTSIFWGY